MSCIQELLFSLAGLISFKSLMVLSINISLSQSVLFGLRMIAL